MNNKVRKPWFKRWQVWAGLLVFLVILGVILPEPPSDKNVKVVKKESTVEIKAEKTQSKTEPKNTSPLTKEEVLENYEIEPSVEPFINGTFTFVGDRTDTADYYSLADTDKFRNASIIFKDGQIARLKLIPTDANNVEKLFEDFGIASDPRKLNGAAGFYEVALIPKYWTQNIEKYPYDKD